MVCATLCFAVNVAVLLLLQSMGAQGFQSPRGTRRYIETSNSLKILANKRVPRLLSAHENEDATASTTSSSITKKEKAKTAKTRKKSKATKKKRKSKSKDGPLYWFHADDPIVLNQTHIHCTIRGDPKPLQRHRNTGRKFFTYNPSASAQNAFAKTLQQALNLSIPLQDLGNDDDALIPLSHFGSDVLLSCTMEFHLARPKSHYSTSKVQPRRLTKKAPRNKRVDVDNLAKFVMDAVNEVVYGDDSQVVSLQCSKKYHDEESIVEYNGNVDNRGKTVLTVQVESSAIE